MPLNKRDLLIGSSSAVLLLGFMTVAQAQSPGIYIGGSWGAYSLQNSDLKKNDNVLKGVVGAQFNDWFAVEGSWTDFNRIDNGGDRWDADGKGLSAVFSMPFATASSVFVKGGQYWWDSDSSLGGSLGASKGNDPFWGVGLKIGLNDSLALRFDAERYDVSDSHINAVTGGVEFKF